MEKAVLYPSCIKWKLCREEIFDSFNHFVVSLMAIDKLGVAVSDGKLEIVGDLLPERKNVQHSVSDRITRL